MNSASYQKPTTMLDDLKENFQKYLKYWYFFLLSLVLSFGGAYIFLKTAVLKYRVSSTLVVQDDKKGDGELKGSAFSDLNMFRSDRKADNEMEALRSRELVYKTLKSLSLDVSYFKKGMFKNTELYGNNLPIKVAIVSVNQTGYRKKPEIIPLNNTQFILADDGERSVLPYDKLISKPGYKIVVSKGPANKNTDPILIKFKDLDLMAEGYNLTGLTVLPILKESNTIKISLLDNIPQRGVDILNFLINTYNEENVIKKNAIAVNTINFIFKKD